jgi:hypothetical protein
MRAIAEEAAALVRRYKGAFSGEHGDGLCRGRVDPLAVRAGARRGAARDQAAFDPAACSTLARSSTRRAWTTCRCCASRRLGAAALRRIPLQPVLDWSAWNVHNDPVTEQTSPPGTGGDVTGGFAKAVEMCNNNGHCRKFDAGTMCPSYRVTRDEQHLTRGRANTLRLALSGQLGPDAMSSDAVYDTMDLCVACKGCKRDCPTGVDMAKMKVEFLAHYKARHGHTLKDRLVAKLPEYAAFASRVPWLLNLRNRIPGAARLGERLTGLSAKRTLPPGAATPSGARGRCARSSSAVTTRSRWPPRASVSPCCSSTPSTGPSRARTRWRRRRSCAPPATPCTRSPRQGGTTAAGARTWPPAWSSRRRPVPGRWSMRCCRSRASASRSSGWSRRAC